MIPERYRELVNLNPLTPLIVSWRELFIKGTINTKFLLLGLAYATIIYVIGYWVYRTLSWRFAEVL